MEQLKSVVPDSLKRRVEASTVDDLHSISSSLLDFFLKSAQFQQMVRDLMDPHSGKNRETAINFKHHGNRYSVVRDLVRDLMTPAHWAPTLRLFVWLLLMPKTPGRILWLFFSFYRALQSWNDLLPPQLDLELSFSTMNVNSPQLFVFRVSTNISDLR